MCERTGFKIRASDSKKEWTGRIVRKASWEPRQPQDFVRGVTDDQSVPEPRPRQTDVFIGVLEATLTASVAAGVSSLPISSAARMLAGDTVQLMLDNGSLFRTTIVSITTPTQIQILARTPFSAASGNLLIDSTAISLPNIG